MVVYYSPQADSLVKGVILAQLRQQECQVKAESRHSLFSDEAGIDADLYKLNDLAAEYSRVYKKDLSWLKEKLASKLHARIYYALRHSSSAKYTIIENALRDALQYGLAYCLNSISSDCRKFNRLSREVFHEVHRMLGFIRFSEYDEKTLVTVPRIYHNTADLILKKFKLRYPGYRLILVLENTALCLDNGKIFPAEPHPYRSFLKEQDSFAGIWEEYYRSQYIDSRKNIRLAQKQIPQKYWDWLTEGKVLTEVKREQKI